MRDYPQQLHKTSDFTVTGCIIFAEPLPTDSGMHFYMIDVWLNAVNVLAMIKEYVMVEEPWENIEVTRTLTPLKIYYDLNLGYYKV